MKNYWSYLIPLALLAGCTAEPLATEENEGGSLMTLVADMGDGDTRTVRQDDGKVFWSPGDEIAVFTKAGAPARFTSSETQPKQRVSFQGKVDDKPYAASYLYAVYPYDPSTTFDGSTFHATVPARQTAVEDSFDPKAFLSGGSSRTQSVTFKHLGGGVKFSVTEEGITAVTLYGVNEEPLAGQVDFAIGSDGVPTLKSVPGPEAYVTLTAPDGGTFEPGKYYHIATLPASLPDGFTLLFEREDGRVASRTVSKAVEIQRTHFLKLTEADRNLTFTDVEFELLTESVNLSAKGQDFVIRVRSYEEPHFDIYADWITFVKSKGDRRVGADYVFHVTRNKETEARTGFVSVCSDTNCYMVDVNQEAPDGNWTTEEFVHHSLGMRFTATWCGYCPMMNTAFQMVKEEVGDKFLYACFYATSGNYGFADMGVLEAQYAVDGYPTGIVDGRRAIGNMQQISATASSIVSAIEETEANYPTVTGVEFSSALSGSTLSVNLDLFAHVADDYKLTVLVLENGIVGHQTDYNDGDHEDFVHDKVVRQALTSVSGDAVTMAEGDEKSFTFSTEIPSGWNKSNLEILVYVQRPFGSQNRIQSGNYGDYYVDNARSAAVGTTAELEFAD